MEDCDNRPGRGCTSFAQDRAETDHQPAVNWGGRVAPRLQTWVREAGLPPS
uniref:Uncharacterized protein n=1 Tax=Anguilla anguilla TaxID=7936 RepID=A0A0E9V1Y8_ANGAN